MATQEENPLIKALPPATDCITYLTIIEYNLTKEQLPLLHEILQDTELTSNIGWDLVQILLPLLPESEECLQDVAKLGNPREVILKVTELLEAVGKEEAEEDEEFDEEQETNEHDLEAGEALSVLPSVLQFTILLRMISILHPRIKTKQPSRFLATSIEAILPAYARLGHSPPATEAVLSLMDSLSRASRPQLPPRSSEPSVPLSSTEESAPDPEASSSPTSPGDEALQSSMLRSFLTHVIEIYIDSLPPVAESSGLAWSWRLYETLHPERMVPFRKSMLSQFNENSGLRERDETVRQLLNRGRYGLGVDWDEVKWTAKSSEREFLEFSENDHLDLSPPSLVASRRGIIYLLTAKVVTDWLTASKESETLGGEISHFEEVKSFIGDNALDSIGTEPLSLIDSILALGFVALRADTGQSKNLSDVDFHQYLQRLSLLSANTPSSNLRFNAHLVTTAILHAHPSPQTRYNFIHDTLQHCPYETLKVSAIGWLKDEILAAASHKESEHATGSTGDSRQDLTSTQEDSTLFSKPATLLDIFPLVFPSAALPDHDDVQAFLIQVPFFLASLNLLYLLCSSALLREQLDMPHIVDAMRLDGDFVMPLVHLSSEMKQALHSEDGGGGDAGIALVEIELLEDTLERVRGVAFPALTRE